MVVDLQTDREVKPEIINQQKQKILTLRHRSSYKPRAVVGRQKLESLLVVVEERRDQNMASNGQDIREQV